MPSAPIPFVDNQQTGLEKLGGAGGVAFNVIADSTGTVKRRPGLQAYAGAPVGQAAPGGVTGLYATQDGRLYVVDGNYPSRNIYLVNGTGSLNLSAGGNGADLDGLRPPVFTETEAILAIAGGRSLQKIVLSSVASSRLGGQVGAAPFEATHVVAANSRLLANSPTESLGFIRYSATASGSSYTGSESWTNDPNDSSSGGFFSADARPDPIVAILQNLNEIFVFGATTLQVWDPDATAVFAPATTLGSGCAAAYSVIEADGQFSWLDERRRFVSSDGRQIEILSDSIQQTLNNISVVADCYGFRFHEGPLDVFVWVFPTDGRTFACQKGVGWAQWSTTSGGNWASFPALSHHFRQATDEHIIGSTSGAVLQLKNGLTSDLGVPINAYIETGYQDRGTSNFKSCQQIQVTLRRLPVATSSVAALISWRDDEGPWEPPLEVHLDDSETPEIVVSFYSLGRYRRRQWRFEFSNPYEISLVSAIETFGTQEEDS